MSSGFLGLPASKHLQTLLMLGSTLWNTLLRCIDLKRGSYRIKLVLQTLIANMNRHILIGSLCLQS
ncbi:hypothetical protein D3C79_1083390 [compost metagenome]